MMKMKEDRVILGLSAAFIGLFVFLGVGMKWYEAGIQAGVYQRQGIEMSQWEVFMGAKPAERTVNIKSEK